MKRALIVLCAFVAICSCSPGDGEPIEPVTTTAPALAPAPTLTPAAALTLAPTTAPPAAAPEQARRRFGQLPVRYEENRGQHDARARYVARQGALTLFATDEGPVLALRVPEAKTAREPPAARDTPTAHDTAADARGPMPADFRRGARAAQQSREPVPSRVHGVRIMLEGARATRIEPGAPLVTRSNYFIGNDPTKWRTDVPNYAALTYRELAPGVDLLLRGSAEGRIEYDFVVAPGTSPELTVRFEGAERVRLGNDGALEVHVGGAVLTQPAPVLYQDIDGRRVAVAGGYRVPGRNRVRFEVGTYDRSRPLVIDPVLVYGTYLGGSNNDKAHGIAVDGSGAAHVAGSTPSFNFPTASPLQPANAGSTIYYDAFVAKLTPSGSALVYATYLGGSGWDDASSIAVDGSGAAYVTGHTQSKNFPTATPMQPAHAGDVDAFVAKLSSSGSALAYATYLGGSGSDYGRGIAVDGSGAAYVAGSTSSADFPTASAVQAANTGSREVFVAKLGPSGSAIAYATYLGGANDDGAEGIAVDGTGAAYVTGYTTSTDFPTVSPLQGAHAGGQYDAFVAKLNPSGSALAYATYLGGSGWDRAFGIAVDGSGAAYVTGYTDSTNFPTASALQATHAGGVYDAFVAKLTPSGSALAYGTYVGGSGSDFGVGIAVDGSGAAYLTGQTRSTNFPTASPLQAANSGGYDAFVAKLTPSGTALAYATYLGGSGDDGASGIAVDASGAAYVTGTPSSNFPTASPLQAANAGGADAFIVKLALDAAGASCTTGGACASSFCTDGVCCDTPCAGGTTDCQACSTAAGAATDGTCGPTTGNACDDGLGCTVDSTCFAGTCGGGNSPCFAPTTCTEASGGAYSCSACPAGTFSADGTGATICTPCTTCSAGEVEVVACTATADTICAPIVDAAIPDAAPTTDAGPLVDATIPDASTPTDGFLAGGGCGCAVPGRTGTPVAPVALFALLGLALARRRFATTRGVTRSGPTKK